MKSQKILSYIPLLCLSALPVLVNGAQNFPLPTADGAAPAAKSSHPLIWDATEKTHTAKPGDATAPFSFWVTNSSKTNVVITEVAPSCGCTVADYPKPWNLAPGASGEVKANMNIAGKTGTHVKTMTVNSTGYPSQVLTLTVQIPTDDNAERRKRNMEAAAKDRQAVFKADCAACHVLPLQGKTGEALFSAGCNICHEPPHNAKRADFVPNLKALPFPTDKAYWKKMIAEGKPGSLMPGFAKAHGGPLTDEEIESLAEYAVKTFKFDPANVNRTIR